MAAITAKAVTGNWSVGANWVGDAAPSDGDTAIIPSGAVITVDVDTIIGASGATGTAGVTVQGTGRLIIPEGVTLTCRGDLIQQRGSRTTVSGVLIIDPPSGETYYWKGDNTGASGSSDIFVDGGAVVGGDRGGISVVGSLATLYQNYSFNAARLENLGSSTVSGVNSYVWVDSLSVGLYARNLLVKNCGKFYIAPSYRSFIDVDGMDIRGAKSFVVFNITSSTAKHADAVRDVKKLTVFDSSSRTVEIFAPDISYSDWILYNTAISTGSGNTVRNSGLRVMQLSTTPGSYFVSNSLSGSTFENFVYFSRASNPHYVETGNAGSLSSAIFNGFLFDGDDYSPADAGDCFIPKGAVTIENPLNINKAGTLISALATTCRATVIHATSHESFRAAIGETAGDDEQLVALKSCLFSSQGEGMAQLAAFVPQSAADISHNAYHNMTSTTNLTHPTLLDRSYVGAESFGSWYATGTFDGTAGRGNGDVSADPQFMDSTRTVRKWFGLRLGVDTSDADTWTMAALAAEAVKLNGIDADGDAAAPVTDLTPANCLSWVRAGFAPTNAALKDAGHDGVTIGALEYVSPDDTAPVLTSASATATSATTAKGSVSTDDGNGTLYFLFSTNPTEDKPTVKAALSQAVTTSGEQTVNVSALDPSTTYYPHFVQTNGAGLDSAEVVTGDPFTTPEYVEYGDPVAFDGEFSDVTLAQLGNAAVVLRVWRVS